MNKIYTVCLQTFTGFSDASLIELDDAYLLKYKYTHSYDTSFDFHSEMRFFYDLDALKSFMLKYGESIENVDRVMLEIQRDEQRGAFSAKFNGLGKYR